MKTKRHKKKGLQFFLMFKEHGRREKKENK